MGEDKVSIIVVHWAQDEKRSRAMYQTILSLAQTAPNAEIIVVDNGGSDSDSNFLLREASSGHIACYVRNRKNMHFGYARNQGIKLSSGDFLVVADNDILYFDGWLEKTISFLKKNKGKYLATPLRCDPMNNRKTRWMGEADGWRLNMRAGSNCTVMRREDFEKIGWYEQHRIAGSKWTDRYVRMGYLMAVMPEPKAHDLGFRKGYNFNEPVKHLEL